MQIQQEFNMSYTFNLENSFNLVEHKLSWYAANSVILPVFGVTKTGLGIVQVVRASVYAIFDGLKECHSGDFREFNAEIEHVKHGFSNIVMGLLQSIPVVQTLVSLSYFRADYNFSNDQKFMPYASVINMESYNIDLMEDGNKINYYQCYEYECLAGGKKPVSYFEFVSTIYNASANAEDDFLDSLV